MVHYDTFKDMTAVTIPRESAEKGDLVLIPRKEYEALLLGRRKVKTFKPSATQKKALEEARKQLARGAFFTLKELRHELDCISS